MKDPTQHRFFVPIATAVSVVISAVSMTWYIAGLFNNIDIRLALLENSQQDLKSLIKGHIEQTSYSVIWPQTKTN